MRRFKKLFATPRAWLLFGALVSWLSSAVIPNRLAVAVAVVFLLLAIASGIRRIYLPPPPTRGSRDETTIGLQVDFDTGGGRTKFKLVFRFWDWIFLTFMVLVVYAISQDIDPILLIDKFKEILAAASEAKPGD